MFVPPPCIITLESHEDFKELPYKIIHDHDLLLVNDPYKYINECYHIIPTDDLDSLYMLIEESIEKEEYEDILKIASLKKVQNKYVRKMLLLPPAKRSLMQRAVDKIKVLIQKLAQRLQQMKRR